MKIPWVPLVVAATLVTIVVFLFNSMGSGQKVFGQPTLEKACRPRWDGNRSQHRSGRNPPGGCRVRRPLALQYCRRIPPKIDGNQ